MYGKPKKEYEAEQKAKFRAKVEAERTKYVLRMHRQQKQSAEAIAALLDLKIKEVKAIIKADKNKQKK